MQAKHFSEIENAELAATHSIMQLASQTYSKYSIQNPAASMSYLLDKLCDLFELPLIMTMMVVGRKGEGSRLMLFKLSDQLPRKPLFGEVEGLCPPGQTRSSCNNIALRDCQNCLTNDTRQTALERQGLSCKYLAHHELKSIIIVVIIIIIIIVVITMIIFIVVLINLTACRPERSWLSRILPRVMSS